MKGGYHSSRYSHNNNNNNHDYPSLGKNRKYEKQVKQKKLKLCMYCIYIIVFLMVLILVNSHLNIFVIPASLLPSKLLSKSLIVVKFPRDFDIFLPSEVT